MMSSYEFEHILAERDREMNELAAALERDMKTGANLIRKRIKNPGGKTTSVAVREAALKQNIIRKLDEISVLAPRLASLMASLHLDEVELALVIEARTAAGIDYWKRLADGQVYVGARHLLDTLAHGHGIDAVALSALSQSEINQVAATLKEIFRHDDSQVGAVA